MTLRKLLNTESEGSRVRILEEVQMLLGGGFWYWNVAESNVIYNNKAFSQLGFDTKSANPTAEDILELVHDNDKEIVKKAITSILNGIERSTEFEYRAKIRTGDWKWFLGRVAVGSKNENGDISLIVGVTIDISHQKELLHHLERGKQRLKKTQKIAHVGTWECNLTDGYNYWSDETYKIFGFKKGDKIKPSIDTISQYIGEDEFSLLIRKFDEANSSLERNQFSYTFKYLGPEEIEKYIRIVVEFERDTNNKAVMWHGAVHDITINTLYERKLKQDKENLMSILINLPSMVFATNHNSEIVFWNKACEAATGFKSKEIVGNADALKLLYPDSELRKKVKGQFANMGDTLTTWEHKITHKNGSKKDISWTAFSDFINVEGWNSVAIGYDFTHQKNNERIQNTYRFKLEALAQTATELVGLPITESIYHYVGTQLERFAPSAIHSVVSFELDKNIINVEGVYGLNMKKWSKILEIIGWNPVGRRFQISDNGLELFATRKLTKIKESLFDFSEGNISSVAAKGFERFFGLSDIYVIGFVKEDHCYGGVVILLSNDSNEIDYSLIESLANQAAVALNRKELENQLVYAKEKAEEADKLKSAFLANMSHEIRTPMNAIIGFSQLLALPNLSTEKKKQYIPIISNKGNSLVKLINDIIDASKVEAGQLTVVFAPCAINNLLKNMQLFYSKDRVLQKREAVEIKLIVPKGTSNLEILTDEGRLEQVLTNLINNALKYTEKGFIEFGYKVDSDYVTFFVKDTGIGIDPQMQTMIFERFRQVEDVTGKRTGGTGLGLSISKGIVNLLGGSIWVESEIVAGTTFYFTIPNRVIEKPVNQLDIQIDEYEEQFPDWRNKVILVAEDEEVNYIFIEELLNLTGTTLLWARDGVQAVELVKTLKKIDLILMDIKMPVMNGYAATMEIRQINPKIPIIAQTAYAFSEDRQKAEAAGCNDYITKPINSKDLFLMMQKYLGY